MMTIPLRRRLPRAWPSLLCSIFLTSQSLAQTAPSARRADPLDPKAMVPALRYESALAQYRRLSDEKTLSWREANDAVARIGGWRVYAREAQQPDAAGAQPSAPPASPAVSPPVSPPPATKPPIALPAGQSRHSGHSGHRQP